MAAPPSQTPVVRQSRFRFHTPPLLLARLQLYPDRLELTGWHLRGRYRRRITWGQLLEADALGTDRLMLWLASGETIRLQVAQAPQWQAAITLEQRRLERQRLEKNASC